MKRNEILRNSMKENNIYIWQVAAAIGVCEQTIIRWFRLPLSDEHYNKIAQAIETLKGRAANE